MNKYSLADNSLRERHVVGGKSLAFVCMFSLNYVSPTTGRALEKKKLRSVDNDLSLTVVSQMHVASNSHLGMAA